MFCLVSHISKHAIYIVHLERTKEKLFILLLILENAKLKKKKKVIIMIMLILENAKLQKSLLNERALLKAENSNIIL